MVFRGQHVVGYGDPLRGRLNAGLSKGVDDASDHTFRLSLTVDSVNPA